MTITGHAKAAIVWLWAGPTVFTSPDGSNLFNYP